MIGRRGLGFLLGACLAHRPAEALTQMDLGTLTPFYRSTQLQGLFIGMGLAPIPQYLLDQDVDLRYRKNSALSTEIPFVDSFTINRFLGGYRPDWLKKYHLWNDQLGRRSRDYVVRGAAGNLQYRPELIRDHLAPYLAAGYRAGDITLALENVPWDLAQSPEEGPWGQRSPPSDMQEWARVISHFAEDLKAYLGPAASKIGFETGVEYDERFSFDASAQQFYQYYAATYRGLKAVLPDSAFSPGEFTGIGECAVDAKTCVYDTQAFVEFCKTNRITVRVIPRSLHALFASPDPSPTATLHRAAVSYDRIPGMIPEVHQFGLLGQPFGNDSGSDPGPVQASWQFQTLIGLWQVVHPRRVFHWGGLSTVGRLEFLNGAGFLRLVLDRYLGANVVALPIEGEDGPGVPTEFKAVGVSGPNVSAVIASSFSRRTSADTKIVRVRLPDKFMKASGPGLKVLRYRASDNVFMTIRRHLASSNNLKPEFLQNPLCVSEPMIMARDQQLAHTMLDTNWPEYISAMKKDLRWQPGERETWIEGGSILRSKLESNELLVVEAEPGRS